MTVVPVYCTNFHAALAAEANITVSARDVHGNNLCSGRRGGSHRDTGECRQPTHPGTPLATRAAGVCRHGCGVARGWRDCVSALRRRSCRRRRDSRLVAYALALLGTAARLAAIHYSPLSV